MQPFHIQPLTEQIKEEENTSLNPIILKKTCAYLKKRRIAEIIFILLISPLCLLIGIVVAIAVKLDSKGAVLFRQTRPGSKGRLFEILKFRSMYSNSSQLKLVAEDDKRITNVGKFIRNYRLDELPQLINILKGEMSLIGPRPVPYNLYEYYLNEIPGYDQRHVVSPGITGLAQVYQGYTNTLEGESEKFLYDMFYIKHASLKLDMIILLRTFKTLSGK
jgi:lipopolysaccharide/colanic/teichoic acid biosynthesis glycosyltransferase